MELTHQSVLLTGATGYVGGRLLPLLESRGVRVRCLTRHPEALRPRVGAGTEIVAGDVSVPATLAPAFAGVTTAYYMIHSMGAGGHFVEEDRAAAETRWCDTFAFQGGARRVRRDTNPRAACVYFQSEIAPRGQVAWGAPPAARGLRA